MTDTTTVAAHVAAATKAKIIRRASTTPKAVTKAKPTAKPAKATAPIKAKTARVAKPSVPLYNFHSGYTGVSDAINNGVSRQPVDHARFGQFMNASLTDRDEQAMRMLRTKFAEKPFERRNLDVGILRRLGERGCITHVGGSAVDPLATYRLTNKGMGRAPARAKKAA
jgi:hypothetical protein